jgi:hypothetical protein
MSSTFNLKDIVALPPSPRCRRCGHQMCPCCGSWCDTLIGDDMDMCCDGECDVDGERGEAVLGVPPQAFQHDDRASQRVQELHTQAGQGTQADGLSVQLKILEH